MAIKPLFEDIETSVQENGVDAPRRAQVWLDEYEEDLALRRRLTDAAECRESFAYRTRAASPRYSPSARRVRQAKDSLHYADSVDAIAGR